MSGLASTSLPIKGGISLWIFDTIDVFSEYQFDKVMQNVLEGSVDLVVRFEPGSIALSNLGDMNWIDPDHQVSTFHVTVDRLKPLESNDSYISNYDVIGTRYPTGDLYFNVNVGNEFTHDIITIESEDVIFNAEYVGGSIILQVTIPETPVTDEIITFE